MENKNSKNSESKTQNPELTHQQKLERYNINKKTALVVIILCIFIDVLGYSMIIPLIPVVTTQTFGASNFMVGIVIASNALATFIFAPLWGKLTDKVGRKGPLIICELGTLGAFMILGISNSVAIILFSRVLDGVFGGQIPIIRAYITDITDHKTRSTEIGRFSAVMAFGTIFGPSIGGTIGVINWRYPAFIASMLSLITIILTIKFLVESMPKQRIMEIKERRILNKKDVKKRKLSYVTNVVILRLSEIILLAIPFYMIMTTFPLVLSIRYGFNIDMIGFFSTLSGICMIIFGAALMKPLFKKFGEKKMLFFSLGLAFVVFMCYPIINWVWSLFIYVVPFVFMHVFLRTIIFTNLTKGVEEDQQGIVSGWATNMLSIGQIISPLIGYYFLDIGKIVLLGLTLDAYFLIGVFCTFGTVILLILVLMDLKKYPEHFEKIEVGKL